jgi:uncharacterized protein YgiM (DUF1202 family)
LRKGRCSNDPKNCTLAEAKSELPYAGLDSVCPECGSPLAALAGASTSSPAPPAPTPTPIVQPVQAAPVAPVAMPSPRFDDQSPPRFESGGLPYRDDFEETASKDGAMKLTQLAIVGAAIALIGFFAWRMFLQPRPVSAPDLAATASVTGVAGQQVTQISPTQLRRVSVATSALSVPDAAGTVIAQLPAGSLLDVSGQIQVAGTNWLRVSLPNDSSRSGFVREEQMAPLGDSALAIAPMDPASGALPSNTVSTVPAAPDVVGPIQAREPTTFYVASRQANIRQEANVASAKVGTFEFTDPITVVAQRSVGAGVWYQVQLPSGGIGWINARLVSTAPRDIPLDRATASPTTKLSKKPETPSDQPTEDITTLDSKPTLTAVSAGTTMRVDSTVANLRKEPGATGNSVVEVLQRDTLMSVEDVRILNGVPWYRVTSPSGAQGWISGRTVVENK